jgi:hypothetical protein
MSTTEKYNRIEHEYESFKNKLVKEFKLLKNQHEEVSWERDILREALLEFKKYFMRFNIDEDGNIKYIESEN